MKKTLPVIRKLTLRLCVVLLFILILSCGGNSINEVPKPAIASTVIQPNPSIKDTSFNTLDELLNYFQPQIIQASNKEVEGRRTKVSGKPLLADSLEKLSESSIALSKQRNKAILKFLRTHEKSEKNFKGFIYLRKSPGVPVKLTDSVFHLFPEALQNSQEGKYFRIWLDQKKSFVDKDNFNLRIMDYPFVDTTGNKTTLKEISSRYILLDFWAAWCGPCRHENAKLVKLKDSLPSFEKFTIVAISLDTNREKWIKAAKEDKLNYLTISDLRDADNSPIAKEFKVYGIPANVLLSKNGKIIAHDLWGEELIDTLNNLP